MLPLCDRVVSVRRSKYLPSRNRGIPIPRQPNTIGGYLRKRRLELNTYQSQVARQIGISTVTLGKWERDRLYPTWPYWSRIIRFLGHDSFKDRTLGKPKGNESRDVAALSKAELGSFGRRIIERRLELMKSRSEMAKELGVSVKTLWGWETNRRQPSRAFHDNIARFVGDKI